MNLKLRFIVLTVLMSAIQVVYSQNSGNIRVDNILNMPCRKEIKIPDIPGYRTLKCDFHIHTLFSDGIVWPSVRVDEAWEEGLDAIAITDHIEGHPKNKFLVGDHNTSFELAEYRAKEKGIILIRGGEITRGMPPGHINAIFLKDVNALDTPDVDDAIMEAYNQGAFIFWNHPGWKRQQPDSCIMFPIHKEFIKKDILNGIEVFNEKEWYPVALKWCMEKGLTIMGNSDIHDYVSHKYDLVDNHRPITLVFAKERNAESIKEALFFSRTAIYFDDYLIGKEEYLREIFKKSVTIKDTGIKDRKGRNFYEIDNTSCIPFQIESTDGTTILIPSNGTIIIQYNLGEFEGNVTNLITGTDKTLRFRYND